MLPNSGLRSIPQQVEETEDQRLARKAAAMGLDYAPRSGGGLNVNDPTVARSVEQISKGHVDLDTVKIWQKRNPRVAGIYGKAYEAFEANQRAMARLQEITSRNIFQGVQEPFQQAGPTRPGETLPFIERQPPSFDQRQAMQMAAQEGLLTPEAQVSFARTAQAFEPQKDRPSPISNLGEYQLPNKGDPVRAWFDSDKQQMVYRDIQGEIRNLPYGARKITPSSTGHERMSPKDLLKLRTDMNSVETGVRAITGYMKRVGESPHGLELLANKWIGKAKTIFGGTPSAESLSVMEQEGRLQGLLGRFREEVVGGGVMTEQDALRVISALGGEPNATRHPEIVRRLMKEILQSKIDLYNTTYLPVYRDQRGRGGPFTQKLKDIEMPKIFDTPLVADLSKKSVDEMTLEELEAEEARLLGKRND